MSTQDNVVFQNRNYAVTLEFEIVAPDAAEAQKYIDRLCQVINELHYIHAWESQTVSEIER